MEKIYFVNSFQYLSHRMHAMFKQIDSCKAHVTHVTNEMKSQAMSIMPTIVYHKICCIFGLFIFRLVFRFNADFLGQTATFMSSMFVRATKIFKCFCHSCLFIGCEEEKLGFKRCMSLNCGANEISYG